GDAVGVIAAVGNQFFFGHVVLVYRSMVEGSGYFSVDQGLGLNPGHHGAQLLADDFKAVALVQASMGIQRGLAGTAFQDEILGIGAVLNVAQQRFHGLACVFGHDAWTGLVFAKFGIVGDAVVQ